MPCEWHFVECPEDVIEFYHSRKRQTIQAAAVHRFVLEDAFRSHRFEGNSKYCSWHYWFQTLPAFATPWFSDSILCAIWIRRRWAVVQPLVRLPVDLVSIHPLVCLIAQLSHRMNRASLSLLFYRCPYLRWDNTCLRIPPNFYNTFSAAWWIHLLTS